MAKNDDVLSRFASAGDNAVGLINRVDDATAKFQPGMRRGSIVKSAQGNVFEFPVFISNSIPLDYATATTSLLEQIYAAYTQMAISINPVVDAASVKNGLQFADFKTKTNKYLEYTDTSYQHDACHAVYQEDGTQFEFNMLSIEDADARLINEAVDHQPLSEFDHFFQEAAGDDPNDFMQLYPMPALDADGNLRVPLRFEPEPGNPNSVRYVTLRELNEAINRDPDVTYNFTGRREEPQLNGYINWANSNHLTRPSRSEINNSPSASGDVTYTDAQGNRHTISAQELEAANRQAALQKATTATRANADVQYTDGRGRTSTITPDQLEAANRAYAIAQADVARRNAEKANSNYYRGADAISTGAKTASDVLGAVNTGANAVANVATLPDQIKQAKYKTKIDKDRLDHLDEDRALKKTEVFGKMKTSDIHYIDDSKCQKLNTMKPLLMSVTINMLNKDDSLQPINYIIGVKTHMRVIPASILPEVARYPLKEMDKISRKVKWRAGELKFLKDLVFRINEKKQTAADSRDPNRKWYRRLYELAHMKGDAPTEAVVQGKSIFGAFIRDKQGKGKLKNGLIPNASIIMSQNDVDNIKNQTEIDLLKASNAKKFCGELFLISLIIVDIDAESIKILLPDQNNDYDVHSLAAVQKQLATLDTSGTKTRDMFKLLG